MSAAASSRASAHDSPQAPESLSVSCAPASRVPPVSLPRTPSIASRLPRTPAAVARSTAAAAATLPFTKLSAAFPPWALFTASPPWALDAAHISEALGVDALVGLSEAEARQRFKWWKTRTLEDDADEEHSNNTSISSRLRQPAVLALLVLDVFALLFAFAPPVYAALTAASMLALGAFVQLCFRQRAASAAAFLSSSTSSSSSAIASSVVCVRNASLCMLPRSSLVEGDIIQLRAGERLYADVRLLSAHFLHADESALTGDAVSVSKRPACLLSPETPLHSRANIVHDGALITAGWGVGAVVALGRYSELGKQKEKARRAKKEGTADRSGWTPVGKIEARRRRATPLQASLRHRMRSLTLLAMMAALCFACILLRHTYAFAVMFVSAVSLFYAAVPQHAPLILRSILSGGARSLLSARLAVQSFKAAEALGSVSCVLVDSSSGLLTRADPLLCSLVCGDKSIDLMRRSGFELRAHDWGCFAPLLHEWLHSSATLRGQLRLATAVSGSYAGAPLAERADQSVAAFTLRSQRGEALILRALRAEGRDVQLVKELPFDTHRRRAACIRREKRETQEPKLDASVDRAGVADLLISVRGELEALLPQCSHLYLSPTRAPLPLTPALRDSILASVRDDQEHGVRFLGFASRSVREDEVKEGEMLEARLTERARGEQAKLKRLITNKKDDAAAHAHKKRGLSVSASSSSLAPELVGSHAMAARLESGLLFVGYMGFRERPCDGVPESVWLLRHAGVAVKVATADSVREAQSVAEMAGIIDAPQRTSAEESSAQAARSWTVHVDSPSTAPLSPLYSPPPVANVEHAASSQTFFAEQFSLSSSPTSPTSASASIRRSDPTAGTLPLLHASPDVVAAPLNLSHTDLSSSGPSVFACLSSEDKMQLIATHQRQGHVVMFSGHTCSDADLLSACDVGFTMSSASAPARESAGVVLLDGDFALVVKAIAEGRRMLRNAVISLQFYLACKMAFPVLLFFPLFSAASSASASSLPAFSSPSSWTLLPVHLIMLSCLTDVAACVVFATEPASAALLRSRKPRDFRASALFGRRFWMTVLTSGAALLISCASVYYMAVQGIAMHNANVINVAGVDDQTSGAVPTLPFSASPLRSTAESAGAALPECLSLVASMLFLSFAVAHMLLAHSLRSPSSSLLLSSLLSCCSYRSKPIRSTGISLRGGGGALLEEERLERQRTGDDGGEDGEDADEESNSVRELRESLSLSMSPPGLFSNTALNIWSIGVLLSGALMVFSDVVRDALLLASLTQTLPMPILVSAQTWRAEDALEMPITVPAWFVAVGVPVSLFIMAEGVKLVLSAVRAVNRAATHARDSGEYEQLTNNDDMTT